MAKRVKRENSANGEGRPRGGRTQDHYMRFVMAIVSGNVERVSRLIAESPLLVHEQAALGASRQNSAQYFFDEIRHYLYAGDTALHMAAAGFNAKVAQHLIDYGADCSARNRRGAEPLHYASDSNLWNPTAQAATIECLLRAGANPNALDKSGVAPLHRAVRTRCAAAVQSLISGGAHPRLKNKSGSTPLHLAVQNTGRGNTGTSNAIEQQRQIILLLLKSGASPMDKDGRGKTVLQAVSSDWIRKLIAT